MRLWDPAAAAETAAFDVTKLGEVRSVAVSPDGKTVAAGLRYGTIKVWDVPTGEEKTLKGHAGDVWGVAFTPDGKTLVSGGGEWNRPGEVKLWDLHAEKEIASLKHTSEVLCVAVSRDGKRMAAGGWDGTIRLWDLEKLLGRK